MTDTRQGPVSRATAQEIEGNETTYFATREVGVTGMIRRFWVGTPGFGRQAYEIAFKYGSEDHRRVTWFRIDPHVLAEELQGMIDREVIPGEQDDYGYGDS